MLRLPSTLPVLTLALGLATAEAIAQATGIACDLRWPNDVMLDDRKWPASWCSWSTARAIAGIGINVNHTRFPPELAAMPPRCASHAGRELSRETLLIALLRAVDRFVRSAEDEPRPILAPVHARVQLRRRHGA